MPGAGRGTGKLPCNHGGVLRAGTGPHLLLLPTRPYGKDVPRLDYWLAYETIMKKVGGRPHWAKVGFASDKLTGLMAWQLLGAGGPSEGISLPCSSDCPRHRSWVWAGGR